MDNKMMMMMSMGCFVIVISIVVGLYFSGVFDSETTSPSISSPSTSSPTTTTNTTTTTTNTTSNLVTTLPPFRCNVFDKQRYLDANPDAKANNWDGLEHWTKYGIHEGRKAYVKDNVAGGYFDGTGYSSMHKDITHNPLTHFLQEGWKENRKLCVSVPYPVENCGAFDKQRYLDANQDVKGQNIDALAHWTNKGIKEGRKAYIYNNSLPGYFNGPAYLKTNGLNSQLDALQHFQKYGSSENRNICIHPDAYVPT